MRHVRFEVANRLVKGLCRVRRFWREELERERRRIRPHNVGDVHDSRLSSFLPRLSVNSPEPTHGTIANTRAGKPEPFFGFGKLTMAIAPASGI